MKKWMAMMFILAAFSASRAATLWSPAVHVKEIWISPGPTPVVRITSDETTNPYYVFYLSPAGNPDLVRLAEDAIQSNLYVKIYFDNNSQSTLYTGLSIPNVVNVSGQLLYTLAISR